MTTIAIRLEGGELPGALVQACQARGIHAAVVHAGGVVQDAVLRSFDPEVRGLGAPRNVPGNIGLVSLDGSFGPDEGGPSLGQRVVLSRESGGTSATYAGELVSARVVVLEVFVTPIAGLARRAAPEFGVTLADHAASPSAAGSVPIASEPGYDELARTDETPILPPVAAPAAARPSIAPAQIPKPIRRAAVAEVDEVFPETGDVIDHFAFGTCEVVMSDGDRLHIKLTKDGRIKEIALSILRVTELPPRDGKRAFKLERKIG